MSDRDEQLRARLAGIDPVPATAPVDPVTGPRAHELLERIMQTNPQVPSTPPPAGSTSPPWWRRPSLVGAAAAAVLVLAVGTALSLSGDDSAPPASPSTVTLTAGSSAAMSSCLAFDVAVLRTMPVAFSGTVTSVEPGAVTLEVDRWYTGGSADQVRISSPPGESAVALDGTPELESGQRYLISAEGGTVSGCGYTGVFSEELAESFQQAFPG